MKHDIALSPYAVAGLRRNDMPKSLKKATVNEFIDATCEYFKLEQSEIVKRCRQRRYVYPRQCCMYLVSQNTPLSLKEIGRVFGGYDHTTVIHSKRAITERIEVGDGYVREDIEAIYQLVEYDPIIKTAI